MKLSEILAKPIKLKGSGVLNLKGFSKQIIDKELEESENESILDKIFNLSMTPHSSKVVLNDTVVDLPDTHDGNEYDLLYKESDFNPGKVIQRFVYNEAPTFTITSDPFKGNTYEIDGESYITIVMMG